MKYLIAKLKKLSSNLKLITRFRGERIVSLIDSILDHNLFKPIAICIIVSFVLINGFDYVHNITVDYKESSDVKRHSTPIKINISETGLAFDIAEEQAVEHRVKSGETASEILFDLGVNQNDAFNILSEMGKIYDLKSISTQDVLSIKYKVGVDYDKKSTGSSSEIERRIIVSKLSISPSVEKRVEISRQKDGSYEAKEVQVVLTKNISRYKGTINNSLFVDGVRAGISATSMMNMINLYSYDVDFQRDIKNGDKFEILVESYYTKEGKKVKDGELLFSSLILRGRPIEMYRYENKNRIEYFDYKGRSIRKSLLRTPINGARVSSSFGMRHHPVLGYSRMHKGVDFAARRGTPILAAGSGRITYYGRRGGYGKFVKIKHNRKYSTAYAHASRFVKKLRVGSRVKQGDVIAYVGTTGRSTGPHLHFEVLLRGKAINPAKVKATSGVRLRGKKLKKFKIARNQIDQYRKTIPNQIKIAQ